MAVIVTGGAGFVGSHLVDRLCEAGKEVVVLDDLSSGQIANVECAVSSGRAAFVFADVSGDKSSIEMAIRSAGVDRIEAVYHLASPASPEAYGANPWETLRVNGMGTMSLIELALEQEALFFYTSTSEVYGDPMVNPQPESYFGNVNPVGPRACYDEGKRFAEAAISVAASRHGLDARIVRLFNCYGPRMQLGDGRLIPALIEAALQGAPLPIHGTGKQTRSLTYIDDIVDGLLHVSNSPIGAAPVNLGNDEELSVNEIARRVAVACCVPFNVEHKPARPEDPQQRRPALDRARAIGWVPTTSVGEGIRRTVEWFRDAREIYSAA
jgi:nucleoside-diphosphate-sugar epimerase